MGNYAILKYFEYAHLPEHLQEVSKHFHMAAHLVAGMGKDPQETAAALRKLSEAKDCAVRAAL